MSIKSRQKQQERDNRPIILKGAGKTLTVAHGPMVNTICRKPVDDDAAVWAMTDDDDKIIAKYTMGQLKKDDPEAYAIHSGQMDILQVDGSKVFTTINRGRIVIDEPDLVALIDKTLAENNPNYIYEAEEKHLFSAASLLKAYQIID